MKAYFIVLHISALTFQYCIAQQVVTPEQERLSIFIGHWTTDGNEATDLEICDWIQGNHVQCKSTSRGTHGVDSSYSYLTYSTLENVYIYYGIYGTGTSRTLRGVWDTDRFILEGGRVATDKTTQWKVTIIPVNQNLHFIEERSINEGPWETRADIIIKRIED